MGAAIAVRHRCLLVVGLAILFALLPSTAVAHTVLVRADPASGAVLAESPGIARLWFSDDMTTAGSSARLVDAGGVTVAGTRLVTGSGDPRVIAVVLPRLRSGSYGLLWQAVSAEDGHTTNGTVQFAIGSGAVAQSAGGGSRDFTDLVRRWVGLAGLAGLVGALAVGLLVVGRRDRTVYSRLMTTAWVAGLASVAVSLVELSTAGNVLSGRRGLLWVVHVAALVALCLLAWTLRRRPSLAVAVVPLLGVLMWVEALGSHAAALPTGRFVALLAAAVHAFAGLLWLGAVPALLVALWPRGRSRADLATLIRTCRGPFSVLAGGSVLLVLVTGLYSAGLEVATTHGLVASRYGQLLLVKSSLLVALGLLGLVNARRLRRSPSAARTIAAESAVGLVLLVAVAALVAQPPPVGGSAAVSDVAPDFSSADGPADRTVLTRSGSVADLVVTVSATPNQPGVNWFTVLAESSRRPAPAAVDRIDLRFGDQLVPLQQLTATRYFATYQAESPGALRVVAVVHRARRQYAVPLDWQVAPAAAPVASGRRLAPYVDGAALALLELAVAACAWWLLRTARTEEVHHEVES